MTNSVAYGNVVKLRGDFGIVSVSSYPGFDPTGVTSSLAAFSAAYSAAAAGQRIQIPPGTYKGVTSVLTGSKFVIWEADGSPTETALWTLPGFVIQGYNDGTGGRQMYLKNITSATDIATVFMERTTSHTGGTPGYVDSNLRVETTVTAGVTNFEWGITSVMQNYSNAGENVAIYGQGNKRAATGPTWGTVSEATDMTYTAALSGDGNLIGSEVDCFANSTDAFEKRVGLLLVCGNAQLIRTGTLGPKAYVYDGIRIEAQGSNAYAAFNYGVNIKSAESAGIVNQANGVRGIYHLGNYQVGIDLAQSTNSVAAIRLKGDENISFNATGDYKLYHNSVIGNPGLCYDVFGATKINFQDNGGITLAGPLGFGPGVTAATATAGAGVLPATPQAFLPFFLNGTQYKIPYYLV